MTHRNAVANLANCALLVVALVSLSWPARAQDTARLLPADATLQRLIAQSVVAVPERARAEHAVQAESERVSQTAAWSDPMLQVGIQNMGFTSIEVGHDPMSYVSFMASQAVPWPGKLGLRRDVAELGASQAQKSVTRVLLSTEAEVRRTYLDLLLVRDRLALLDRLDELWLQSLGIARVRYEAGDGPQSDVLRAQLEINRVKQRRFTLQAQERASTQVLNRLRNHPLDEPIETTSHIRDLRAPGSLAGFFSVERALSDSPELAAARLATTRSDKAMSLAQKSYYPDLTVGAGVMLRGPLPPMWVLTLGGPLPVFAGSKQSRAVAENRALAQVAQGESQTIEQVLRLRSSERRTVFDALLKVIELYQQGLLVQSEATTESTLAQYTVGKVSFASVLDANAGLIADEEGFLQALADAHRILIAEAELSLAPLAQPAAMGNVTGPMPGIGSTAMPSSGAAPSASPSPTSPAAQSGGGSASSM